MYYVSVVLIYVSLLSGEEVAKIVAILVPVAGFGFVVVTLTCLACYWLSVTASVDKAAKEEMTYDPKMFREKKEESESESESESSSEEEEEEEEEDGNGIEMSTYRVEKETGLSNGGSNVKKVVPQLKINGIMERGYAKWLYV